MRQVKERGLGWEPHALARGGRGGARRPILRRRLHDAIEHLNDAISGDRGLAEAYAQRGRAFRLLKEFGPAVEDLRWASHAAPSSETAHYELAAAYMDWFGALCGEVRYGRRAESSLRKNAELLVLQGQDGSADLERAVALEPTRRAYYEHMRREAVAFHQWKQQASDLDEFFRRALATYQPGQHYYDTVCSKCGSWYNGRVGCSHG